MTTFPTPWLKITSGEISVNQQEHVGNLAVIELLRRVLGRAAAPTEALDPRRLNRGMLYKYTLELKMQVRSETNQILANDAET